MIPYNQVITSANAYQLTSLHCYHWIMSHVGLICNRVIELHTALSNRIGVLHTIIYPLTN